MPRKKMLHPADILAALKSEAQDRKKIFKDKAYVPERYDVSLSLEDLAELKPFMKSFAGELKVEMENHIQHKGYLLNTPGLQIDFHKRIMLRPGQFEVVGRFEQRPEESTAPGGDQEPPPTKIRLRLISGTPAENTIELDQGAHTLGRGKAADILLSVKDPLISRVHCEIAVTEREVRVKDLESANGTLVNGELISGEKGLDAGDRLLLGNTEIEVEW